MREVQKYLEGQVADGRYPLIELLGTTQHNSVFRTECEDGPNRQAAIKLIPAPAGASGAQLTRWRLAARFSHPGLLRIYQMGRCEFEGRPMLYVVMELAEENLAEILPVRCLSPGETDAMLAPALDALSYLHGKGFVHGHVQPSNILAIGEQVKLSSDSISRIGEVADPHEPGDGYRAPEVSLSAASDVWSLGITIVQCLTGRVPERNPEGRNSVSVPPVVPPPFFDLARHCLNPVAQRRWSVAQMQSALAPRSTTAPVPAPVDHATADDFAADPAANSAFAKPDAVVPVRHGFRLKKQYRLALAALAAATAAFVLGVVISSSGSDTTVTGSAPAAKTSKTLQPGTSAKDPLATSSAKATFATRRQQHSHADSKVAETKSSDGPRDSTNRHNTQSGAQFARSGNPAPAMIVSNLPSAAPAESTSSTSPPSTDVVPGAVSRRALPRVPTSASNTIWGTVRVSVIVDVDPRGRVVEAKLDSPGPSRYFAGVSVAAAQDWKFTPPRVDGKIVPSLWVINFGYSKTDTSAAAIERHP